MLNANLRRLAEEHVNALAARHRITVHRSPKRAWQSSEADLSSRQVFIPKGIRQGIEYLVALHEIGHIVDRSARSQHLALQAVGTEHNHETLLVEAAAWAWAIKSARPVILQGFTKTDWRMVGYGWASHAGPVW